MVDKTKIRKELESVEKSVRLSKHAHRRASQRNIDTEFLKKKVASLEFEDVRENSDSDPRFEKTYKVVVQKDSKTYYEAPIYFNMYGNEIYVKTCWQK